ncbi:MAG: efflux RND transporter permease subunit [Candidatus Omnitrophica bacterium]|nr:efflux RND transporter permease subunit [Candidatus Omnitrophota bacterium]
MSLPRFSVNQSLFVNLLSVIIMIIGLNVAMNMNKEIFPNVNFDTVTVTTIYAGATPEDVEKLITTPIEKELKQVDGIKEINSNSVPGISILNIEIDPDEDNKQKVIRDIQNYVDRVKDLPKDVDDPIVAEVESKQFPIIEVALSGDMPEQKLREHADILEDIFEDLSDVARVIKSGYREREIHILVDPYKLREFYVSIDEIEEALASRNISLPAGELNTETTEYSVRTTGEFLTSEEIEEVIIRANDSGNWLRVKDVAVVKDSFKDEDIINKTLGTRSVNLVILKKESGDALRMVDEIKKLCNKYLKTAKDGLRISYVNDYSYYARRRLNVLTNNALSGGFIVIALLMVFLEKRVAFLTFLGIPVAFFATFIVMKMLGITINLISMFGLIIVLGMLVDDGIIVGENIYSYIEKGYPPREAAVIGAEEVMGPVFTAVATTIAAFSPLLFMTGIMGSFIKAIPVVLIVALIASLGEAVIILPSHMADFVKIKKDKDGNVIASNKQKPWFKTMIDWYTKLIRGAIRRKWTVIICTFTMIFVCIVIIISAMVGKGPLRFILFPSVGINYLFIRGEAPIGTPLKKTVELIKPVEDIIAQLPDTELDTYVTTVGQIQEDEHDPFAGNGSHLVQLTVYLTREQDRKRSVDQIINELREKIKDIKGFEELKFDKPQSGPPVGSPISVRIRGEKFEVLDKIADEYMSYMRTLPGVYDISWDNKPGKEEILIDVDREKATMAGVSYRQIAKTMRAVFEGGIATTIKPFKAEEETDVTVRFNEEHTGDVSVFDNVIIQNKFNTLVPLNKIASIKKVPGSTTIHHLDGKRVVTVTSNLDTKKTTSVAVNSALKNHFSKIEEKYPGYTIKYSGEQERSEESLKSLLDAFIYAFLVIYLILAGFFRSLVQPVIVMSAIFFGFLGVVIAFLLHNMAISFMAILGIVGLNGIVVNDSIVLVDFINKLRKEGMSRRQSIIKAGQMRIRPVLLTTITTVGGLCTVAYGIGGKDPFLVPMALSICWGLSFATIMTLTVIPCIYSAVDDIAQKVRRKPKVEIG